MINLIKQKQEGMFSNRMIINLLIPILIEQSMIVAIGIADTLMVTSVGEAAVAGVSLISTIDTMMKQIMVALTTGGAVVISQYVGKDELHNANKAMKMSLYSILFLSLAVSLVLLIFQRQFLTALYGAVAGDVMQSAQTYFALSLLSYPFLALYYGGATSFRAMNNSIVPMFCSLSMMGLNLLLKAIMIYKFHMGVKGAAISTLVATMFIGTLMMFLMCKRTNRVYIEKIYKVNIDFSIMKRVLSIGIPNGFENGLFQFGILILQTLVSSFGTASIAANAVVKSLAPLSQVVCTSFSLAVITIVGQCMGAREKEQASFYIKHILKLNYISIVVLNIFLIISTHFIVGKFNLSAEVNLLVENILYMYYIGTIFFYPTSFALPNALRGAGDTKFTMVSSVLTMFGARIGLAYIFGLYMKMGIFGIWLAMQADWIVRSVIFVSRFKFGKWKEIKVI